MNPAVLVTALSCALQLALAMEREPDEAAGAGHRLPSERNRRNRMRNRIPPPSSTGPTYIHHLPSNVVYAYFPSSRTPTSSQAAHEAAHRGGTAQRQTNSQSTTTNHAEGVDHSQSLGASIEGTSGSQGDRRLRQAVHRSRHDRVGQAAQPRLQEILSTPVGRAEDLPYSSWEHPTLTHPDPLHGHHTGSHTHIGFERLTRTAHGLPPSQSPSEVRHWALTMSGNGDDLHGESSAGPHAGHHAQGAPAAGLHGERSSEPHPGHHQQELPSHLWGVFHQFEHHHPQEPLPAVVHGESSSVAHGVHHPQQLPQHLARMFTGFEQHQHLRLDTAPVAPPLDAHSQANSPAHASTELPLLAPGTFHDFARNHYPTYDSTSPPSSPLFLPQRYKKGKYAIDRPRRRP